MDMSSHHLDISINTNLLFKLNLSLILLTILFHNLHQASHQAAHHSLNTAPIRAVLQYPSMAQVTAQLANTRQFLSFQTEDNLLKKDGTAWKASLGISEDKPSHLILGMLPYQHWKWYLRFFSLHKCLCLPCLYSFFYVCTWKRPAIKGEDHPLIPDSIHKTINKDMDKT